MRPDAVMHEPRITSSERSRRLGINHGCEIGQVDEECEKYLMYRNKEEELFANDDMRPFPFLLPRLEQIEDSDWTGKLLHIRSIPQRQDASQLCTPGSIAV